MKGSSSVRFRPFVGRSPCSQLPRQVSRRRQAGILVHKIEIAISLDVQKPQRASRAMPICADTTQRACQRRSQFASLPLRRLLMALLFGRHPFSAVSISVHGVLESLRIAHHHTRPHSGATVKSQGERTGGTSSSNKADTWTFYHSADLFSRT